MKTSECIARLVALYVALMHAAAVHAAMRQYAFGARDRLPPAADQLQVFHGFSIMQCVRACDQVH